MRGRSSERAIRSATRAAAVLGGVLLGVGVVALVFWTMTVEESSGLVCDNDGCVAGDPVLYTLVTTSIRLAGPVVGAGVLAVGAALVMAAAVVRGNGQRRSDVRAIIALWVIGVVSIVGSVALVVWSSSPGVVGYSVSSDRASQLLIQAAYSVMPFLIFAGLVLVGMALVATLLRARVLRADAEEAEAEAHAGRQTEDADPLAELLAPQPPPTRPWRRGDDLTPFMRPDDRPESDRP
ncbi:hypothetical protein ACFJGV_08455 [Cnuibacter sp. UC19_7]|uniref:hypothetical protein n=1 Tax=Cnuibacter sp. UC19_7 TaxID=3350166 RepID=UPI0036732FA7